MSQLGTDHLWNSCLIDWRDPKRTCLCHKRPSGNFPNDSDPWHRGFCLGGRILAERFRNQLRRSALQSVNAKNLHMGSVLRRERGFLAFRCVCTFHDGLSVHVPRPPGFRNPAPYC